MKIAQMLLGLGCVLMFLGGPAAADWSVDDGHKMHYPQLPKAGGWDVAFSSSRLADDWRCSETGPVEDVHFWISWQQDQVQPVTGFSIRIHSDIPDPDGPGPLYSMPAGDFLFERDFGPADFTVKMMPDDWQGWFDPFRGLQAQNDHVRWAQINVENIEDPFPQEEGTIYWLEIDGFGLPNAGWKQSGSPHYGDDAVAWMFPQWIELRDPITQETLDLAFVITPEPTTLVLLGVGVFLPLRRRRR